MPPWAQTECERLTGTIENKSTCPPASAILMTAASPANPPPTTMILGTAIFYRILSSTKQDIAQNQKSRTRNHEPGIGGAKRKGAAIRFQALIWLMATVRSAISCSEKWAATRA